MSWKKLQAESKIHAHKTSKKELDELRALIARDLEGAAIQELSDDRRFATAYNAALQTTKMAIACAGYRLASAPGHHRLTFEAARLALGATADRPLDFFEACRRNPRATLATHSSQRGKYRQAIAVNPKPIGRTQDALSPAATKRKKSSAALRTFEPKTRPIPSTTRA